MKRLSAKLNYQLKGLKLDLIFEKDSYKIRQIKKLIKYIEGLSK